MTRPAPLAVAGAALLLLSGCLKPLLDLVRIDTVKGVLTSSGDSPDAGGQRRDFPLLEYALVAPLVARPYRAPAEVGRCWQRWARAPAATDTLFAIGARRDAIPADLATPDGGTALTQGMDRAVACGPHGEAEGQPFFRCGADGGPTLVTALDCPVAAGDRLLLAYAVLQVADAVYAQRSALWPAPLPAHPGPSYPAYLAGVRAGLADAAELLLQPTPGPQLDARGTLPALALSGGAANGAFTAGFTYRLLAVREQALAAAGAAGASRIASRERFGGVVSTSVGSLIAPVLDLYFDDARSPGATPPPLDPGALEDCQGSELLPAERARVPSGRAPQACALRLLRRYFTRVHDWHLLCVEDASLTELLGVEHPAHPVANALAFDPMRDRVLTPFFRTFGARLVSNEVLVQQMAVDVEQRVTLGLDERVCASRDGEAARTGCLLANTMSSLVEPVLARHLDEVHARVGQPPVRGQWVDGGLRSGSPTLRALRLTGWPLELASSTAVLSLSTHRSEGTPTTLRATLPALVFDTVGTFADQIRALEIAYTGALAEVERTELEVWSKAGTLHRDAAGPGAPAAQVARARPQRGARHPGAPAPGALVDSVVMPENVAFGEPIATATLSEYSFDPVVMTQLFVEGELTAVLGLERRLGELGWTEVQAWYARPAHRQAVEDEVRARWEQVRTGPADGAAYQAAVAARRQECLQVCARGGGPAPATTPRCLEVVPEPLLELGRPPLPW